MPILKIGMEKIVHSRSSQLCAGNDVGRAEGWPATTTTLLKNNSRCPLHSAAIVSLLPCLGRTGYTYTWGLQIFYLNPKAEMEPFTSFTMPATKSHWVATNSKAQYHRWHEEQCRLKGGGNSELTYVQ
jgi:hypothetical protein